MNFEDQNIHNHIYYCKKDTCRICSAIYKEYFFEDSQKRAILKYQQTEKFKEYKKNYYLRNRERILEKYRNKNINKK
jgi:hypothetical protein